MKRHLRLIIGLAIILSLAAFDQWAFSTWLKTSYLNWYLRNGALMSLIFTIVSLSVGNLNKYTDLISRRAHIYLAAYMRLISITLMAAAGVPKEQRDQKGPERRPYYLSQTLVGLLETLISVPIVFGLIGLLVAWLVIVAPLQYFIFLICGAPIRIGVFQVTERTIVNAMGDVRRFDKDSEIPNGWWEVGFHDKPIAVTNLIAALFLSIVRFFFS
jgi:hypothetical protein